MKKYSLIIPILSMILLQAPAYTSELFDAMINDPLLISLMNLEPIDNEELIPKSTKWTNYKQTFGTETIQVKFPSSPAQTREKDLIFIYAEKKDTLHTLITANPPHSGVDPEMIFPVVIAALCQNPNYLVGYKTMEIDGYEVLDTTSQDINTKMVTKSRLIITPNNFYMLRTYYYYKDAEKHDLFVNSFTIN